MDITEKNSFSYYRLIGSLLFCASLIFSGCSKTVRLHTTMAGYSSYCEPEMIRSDSYYATLPVTNIDSVLKGDTVLHKRFSDQNLLMANATGTLGLLQKLILAEKDSSIQGRLNYVGLRSQIVSRVLLAASEVMSLTAEIDCEGERADQLAAFLDDMREKRNRKLTALSIIVGSATIVITTGNRENGTQRIAALVGGIISAVAGGMTAFPDVRKVSLNHERNLLGDIWYDPDKSMIYPAFIWYVLHEKAFAGNVDTSVIQGLRSRWIAYELGGKADDKVTDLLFGKGGYYTAENLHKRADMLNQLQSTVRSIHQDLRNYLIAINNLY